MPFRLKNATTIFSRLVIVAFKEFIHKFLEVYFDDWTVFRLVKHDLASLHLMFGYMSQILDRAELEEMYILCAFWKFSRPCSMQARIDGGPYEDSSDCEFRSSQEC